MPSGSLLFSVGSLHSLSAVHVAQPAAEVGPAVEAQALNPRLGRLVAAREVGEVARDRRSIIRDHRVSRHPSLAETRVLLPDLADHLNPIRIPPIHILFQNCPAGGTHEHGPSANYTLRLNRAGAEGQSSWRWCRKCQGLAYGDPSGGLCPTGGPHDFSLSGDYVLHANVVPGGHQGNWRWCRKCQGLAYNAGGGCPAGGAHDHSGSWDYALAMDQPEAEGQPNWRWCSKCQGLAFGGGPAGAAREELGLPVAASDPVDANAVFEAPSGPERFHLPLYRLARRVVSGRQEYQIRIGHDEHGQPRLSVTLDKLRPEGIPPEAGELAHELLLQLQYALAMSGGGATTKTLDFTAVGLTEDGAQVMAWMQLASPAERDQVLNAITTSGSACGITARRSVRVAVPIAGEAGRFRPVTRGLEQKVEPDPLFLHPSQNPYLHDGTSPAPVGAPGLVLHQLPHGPRFHSYWQDAADPGRVFYLPDAFRFARRDKPAPFIPMMRARLTAGATPEADPEIAFDFAATPWSDARRLEAARDRLAGSLAADQRAAGVRMEPLPVAKASFWLALPGSGGLEERPKAQMDVRAVVVASETLTLPRFQAVYDAMKGGSVAIMNGEVRVDFGQGASDRIPFEGRFDRMNGDLFETAVAAGDGPGRFTVTLRNAIESPVRVGRLGASLLAGEAEVAAEARVEPALPVVLQPGEAVVVAVSPKEALAPWVVEVAVEPLIDLAEVQALPDGERIWEAIFSADPAVEPRRTIAVKLFPGMFDAPSGRPEDKAVAVIVQFEGGPAVELTPEDMAGEARIPSPVTDIVLGRSGGAGYRYKTQVIRRSQRLADADWRTDSTDLLIPLLPDG